MTSLPIDRDGAVITSPGLAGIARGLEQGTRFWLDLHGIGLQRRRLLREVFNVHAPAAEGRRGFGQRAKAEACDGFPFSVAFGAVADEDGLLEVHCLHPPRFPSRCPTTPVPARRPGRAWEEGHAGVDGPVPLLHGCSTP